MWWSDWHSKPVPPWVLLPCRKQRDGATLIEVNGDEIKNYNSFDYWLAIRFWKDYKTFGLPGGDFRKLTPQQKSLISLYNDLEKIGSK